MSAAFMMTASGMSSKTAPSTSIVRQASSPQTEQHILLPTPAPTLPAHSAPPVDYGPCLLITPISGRPLERARFLDPLKVLKSCHH
jgi:hypothetical protein